MTNIERNVASNIDGMIGMSLRFRSSPLRSSASHVSVSGCYTDICQDPQERVRAWNDSLQGQQRTSPSVQDTISDITTSSETSVQAIGIAPTPQYRKRPQLKNAVPSHPSSHNRILQSTTKSSPKAGRSRPNNGLTSMINL
jgi:hypothetical protein